VERKSLLVIRPENNDDIGAITSINNDAFGQQNEGRFVEKLRRHDRYIPELSLVALLHGKPVGHILFFPIMIIDGKYQHESLALAPISVHPACQNIGIGSALVRAGLSVCRQEGFESVIVLGHPEFYQRFSFQKASRWKISAPFAVPDEAFMALELEEHGLRNVQGVVKYPEEFKSI
jgi:putative acetyltransferase